MKTQWLIPIVTTTLLFPMALSAIAETVADPREEQVKQDPFDVQQLSSKDYFWTRGEFKMGLDRMSGNNTYQIGGPIYRVDGSVDSAYFPFSELEFPMDISMLSASYEVVFKERWIATLSGKTDIQSPDDEMIDKDWITSADPSQLDIYSNSEVKDFSAYEWDISLAYKVLKGETWSVSTGAGFQYQDWSYAVALIQQYSPSNHPDVPVGSGDGSISIKYDLSYEIPYLMIGGDMTLFKNMSLHGSVAYSPWVTADNRDQHIWRGKVNEGELDGDYFMTNLEARYTFSSSWFLSLGYQYKKIETDGRMTGEFYATPELNHSVEEELETIQHTGSFMIGYVFK